MVERFKSWLRKYQSKVCKDVYFVRPCVSAQHVSNVLSEGWS